MKRRKKNDTNKMATGENVEMPPFVRCTRGTRVYKNFNVSSSTCVPQLGDTLSSSLVKDRVWFVERKITNIYCN